ncbi:MAG: class I SAM-dependent methyltransferase, partial [Selenomonas sp.]
ESAPVSLFAVAEACRVAKRRVVLKENSRSLEFARLGFSKIAGGKYSPVHYGVIDVCRS